MGGAEVAHEEALDVVELRLEDAAVGLHDRRAQDDHGGREVTGAGLASAGAATGRAAGVGDLPSMERLLSPIMEPKA